MARSCSEWPLTFISFPTLNKTLDTPLLEHVFSGWRPTLKSPQITENSGSVFVDRGAYLIANSNQLSPKDLETLLQAARQALEKAYAPYSNFHVGAALLTAAGELFTGCNVENASYGLTVCAERAAVFAAVHGTKAEKLSVRAIVVVNGNNVPCSPCGACRQVIAEFGDHAVVVFQVLDGFRETSIQELLPETFRL